MKLDERILVIAAADGAAQARQDTALVLGPDETVPPGVAPGTAVERLALRPALHDVACACCAPRVALAEALHRLFLRRARGEVAFFRSVVVSLTAAEIGPALADPLVAPRFRADALTTRTGFRCD
jgi:hypothetical protein